MNFADENWALGWALVVAIVGGVLPLVFLEARSRAKREEYWHPTLLDRVLSITLSRPLRFLWGGVLLFLLLLPLVASFQPENRPRPTESGSAELAQAMNAQAQATTRLARAQLAASDRLGRRSGCRACEVEADPPRPRILGGPLGWSGLAGFLMLFAGLWMAFAAAPEPEAPPQEGSSTATSP
jgi:hypothetical protein